MAGGGEGGGQQLWPPLATDQSAAPAQSCVSVIRAEADRQARCDERHRCGVVPQLLLLGAREERAVARESECLVCGGNGVLVSRAPNRSPLPPPSVLNTHQRPYAMAGGPSQHRIRLARAYPSLLGSGVSVLARQLGSGAERAQLAARPQLSNLRGGRNQSQAQPAPGITAHRDPCIPPLLNKLARPDWTP
eukprot:scaffold21118_cov112-Isochrysis_galbana.AAC.2